MIRRISEAGEKILQILHQVIFDCSALPRKETLYNLMANTLMTTRDWPWCGNEHETWKKMTCSSWAGYWDWKRDAQWMA
jgi:hypothetical protein